MSLQTERKLLEWGKWYDYHKNTITDTDKRCEFLEKAVDNMGHMLIHLIEDIRVLEGRGRIGKSTNIITPHGNMGKANQRTGLSGDLRKDGGKMDLGKIANG